MKNVNIATWGMKTNLWRDLNRLMGCDKGTAHGSVGDHVVARVRCQAMAARTIELNFKQLLMQWKIRLIRSKKPKALRRFIKVNDVSGNQSWRRKGYRIDLWIQGTQLPAKPSGLLRLVEEPRTV